MMVLPTVSSVEKKIGLEYYITDTSPLGGRLKDSPEDFVVNEISDIPEKDPDGQYVICKVRSRNWETNRLIRSFSKSLRISRSRIKFAGTKDKRAVTTQLFSFPSDGFDIGSISIKDVDVLDHFRSRKDMELGGLLGNSFEITVNGLDDQRKDHKKILSSCMEQLVKEGGFPNFFGIQRFGVIRPITHLVGESIVKGDLEKAVMHYLGDPKEKEEEEVRIARRKLERDLDFEEALDYFPSNLIFERTLIHHMRRNPGDWGGALNQLPDNLRMMFVHAYQSYLFNKILSQRIKKGLPLGEPVAGDVVIPLNKKGLPDHRNGILVRSSNYQNLCRLVKRKKGFVSGLIFGLNSIHAEGEPGDIEERVIGSEGIISDDFKIAEVEKVSSKGMRREFLSPIFDLKWKIEEAPLRSKMNFSLFRGTYATSLMREVLKGQVEDY